MGNKEIIIKNEKAMAELAASFAPTLKQGDVIALSGDLGAGKTSFTRALIHSVLGKDINVPSPTFTLVQMYDFPNFPLYHFDLYRLEDSEEIWALGWEDALNEGVCIVEWPEKAEDYFPQNRIDISIKHNSDNEESRIVTVQERSQD